VQAEEVEYVNATYKRNNPQGATCILPQSCRLVKNQETPSAVINLVAPLEQEQPLGESQRSQPPSSIQVDPGIDPIDSASICSPDGSGSHHPVTAVVGTDSSINPVASFKRQIEKHSRKRYKHSSSLLQRQQGLPNIPEETLLGFPEDQLQETFVAYSGVSRCCQSGSSNPNDDPIARPGIGTIIDISNQTGLPSIGHIQQSHIQQMQVHLSNSHTIARQASTVQPATEAQVVPPSGPASHHSETLPEPKLELAFGPSRQKSALSTLQPNNSTPNLYPVSDGSLHSPTTTGPMNTNDSRANGPGNWKPLHRSQSHPAGRLRPAASAEPLAMKKLITHQKDEANRSG
jgi:hypothetical protein